MVLRKHSRTASLWLPVFILQEKTVLDWPQACTISYGESIVIFAYSMSLIVCICFYYYSH